MKYLIFISLLFSCSTKQITSQSNKDPGESDARQVSPYTVKPCFCMKIYQPVCAGGITYGNSCEAECAGHKKWTEGPCKTTKKNKK